MRISVWGHSDLQQEVIVDPDGEISFPLVGNIEAAGLTTEELKTRVTAELSAYLKEPRVNVFLLQYQKVSIMVLGAVNKPGTYQLRAGEKALDALALSGGPRELADLTEVKLTRQDVSRTLNLEDVYRGTAAEGNIELADGDVLFIPEGAVKITVMGEVKAPGQYKLEKGSRLTDLLARAGGVTPSASSQGSYTTENEVKSFDINKLINGTAQENPVLKDGDSLYIPKTTYEVTILGEVNRPGSYPWNENLRLADLLARAGNQTERGDLEEVKLTHRDGSFEIYNMKAYFNGQGGENPSLKPGDIVLLQELKTRPDVTILGEVNRPGSYPWDENLKLADLIGLAGNQTERGDLQEVKLMHRNGVTAAVNLKEYLNGSGGENPALKPGDVIVIKEKEESAAVTIQGEVNRPGAYPWEKTLNLADLLARAGNATDRGDIEVIHIIHHNGSTDKADLKSYLNGRGGSNPELQPGDVVVVEEKKESSEVTILGEINRPGAYPWDENLLLADLLARAGNQTQRGDIAEIKVMHRNGESEIINLEEYLTGKGGSNPALQPGDVVIINEFKTSPDVTILGEINRPGAYSWDENLTLADLLARAGNQTNRGDITKIKVMHRSGESEYINLEKYLLGEGGSNPVLQSGDVVVLSELKTSPDVTILGEVNRPGAFPWSENLKLADLLGRAGNQTTMGDIEKIKIMHRDGQAEVYNLREYFNGKEGENPPLLPGDIVMVNKVETVPEVTILGEVNRPGSYSWNEGLQLADLLGRAGNGTKRGNLDSIKLLHRSGKMEVKNIHKYFDSGIEGENPLLKPGDLVMVDEVKTSAEVTILGEVNRPGTYPWDENLNLVNLLARAGNGKERGDLENIQIMHPDGAIETVNLEQYYSGESLEANPLLQPGDIVKIGEISGVDWQQVFGFVSGLNLLKDFLEINW